MVPLLANSQTDRDRFCFNTPTEGRLPNKAVESCQVCCQSIVVNRIVTIYLCLYVQDLRFNTNIIFDLQQALVFDNRTTISHVYEI